MSRVIDLQEESEQLAICFAYNKRIIAEVKSLPGRQYDPGTKDWYVPLKHLELVVRRLEDYHFKFSSDLRAYCRREDIDLENLAESEPDDVYLPVPPDTFSVSELNREAKMVLEEALPDHLWIVGEVQGYDQGSDGGHAFFELVERFSEDTAPTSKIRVVAFQRNHQHIQSKLKQSGGGIELRDGLAVRLRGRAEIYEKGGRYQFIAEEVDPLYTQGDLHRNREKILKSLDKADIKEDNISLAWPPAPLKVGLITSFESSAYTDFVDELKDSGYGFELTTYDVNVQGERTEKTVLAGLKYFRKRADAFDIVAVVRGGGARSELAYFDTEDIGEAVCRHPVKIICGIGHHPDRCLLDYISESHKTPTAAGKAITDRVRDYIDRIQQLGEKIGRRVERSIEKKQNKLSQLGFRLQRRAGRRISSEKQRLGEVQTTLISSARNRMRRESRQLEYLSERFGRSAKRSLDRRAARLEVATGRLRPRQLKARLERERKRLERAQQSLIREATQQIENERKRLEFNQQRVESADPVRVLERGYAIVRVEDTILTSRRDIPEDKEFTVEFSDGDVSVIRTNQNSEQGELE